jgi:arylsulfatase A-like enzyme
MRPHRIGLSLAVLVVVSQTVACRGAAGSGSAAMPIRLVDTFDARLVSGGAAATRTLQRTEFRFSDPPAGAARAPVTRANAGPGVADLSVREGLLVGRVTDDFPVVHIERTSGLDNPDTLHAIEVRLRSSAGANLWVQTAPGATVDLADQRERTRNGFPWPMQSPLKAGAEMQTYIVSPSASTPMSRVRHILIRPTDAAGASFSIESVRLVSRAEHLAAIPSGVGWQGLSEIYRESLVARAPEAITYTVDLPDRPWFDVAVGTIEDGPVTFRVSAKPPDASDESRTIAVEYTVTRPHRWSVFPIDLTPLAGRPAAVRLELRSETTGAIGFWGAPVIRDRRVASDAAREASTAPPRGVILIHADTLRRDHLNFYGHTRETAPFLTRLAQEGVRFNHAISPASWTKVATPSIQTGLYPTTHGVRVPTDRLPSSATTIAEVYRAAGYATFATSSVVFTGQMTNLHQGYEELHENGSLSSQGTPLSSKTSREYVDRLTEWIDRHRDVPFFAYLHVFDPHSPYEPYAPYNTMWGDASRREEHLRQRQQVTKFIADPAMRGRQLPSREELLKAGFAPESYVEQLTDWYDGSIRGLDVEIARLFEHLARLGLDEGTLVALTSDHGTEFHDHGRFFHGQTVYGELINIPLLIRWPGRVASGRAIDELVQSIDVMPTLLDLSGLAVPEGVQGQSLLPFVQAAPPQAGPSPQWKPRPAIAERFPAVPDPAADERRVSHAIIEGNWKLIHNSTTEPGLDEFELFDYFKDPLNKQSVAASHPEVVARLTKALAGWRQMATAARLKPDSETTKGLSAEELQRLRSLGYVR